MKEVPHRSILVVEDDPFLAMDLESTLTAGGFIVMGPAVTTDEAFTLLRDRTPDLTVLDLNLGSEMVFPVADFLARTGVPFLILSGHSRQMVPAQHRDRPFLQKPHAAATLLRTVRAMLDGAGGRATAGP
jgi:DNA-binding response OmpR family regulator